MADGKDFEVKIFGIGASPEQTRPPRRVKIAVVQNAIVLPTTDPVSDQVRVRGSPFLCAYDEELYIIIMFSFVFEAIFD